MTAICLLLLGAAIGFGIDRFKAFLNRRTFKRQLTEELIANLGMLPFLRRHLIDSVAMAQQGGSPNMRAVHFCTVCYDAHFSALLPILSSSEQISIQFIYEYLRTCNEITDAYSQLVFTTSDQAEYSRLLRLYGGTLASLIKLTESTEDHIRRHLAGTPTLFLEAK